jgi:hypothetical protein
MILVGSGKTPCAAEQGDNSVEQGDGTPCSMENRDISRARRAACPTLAAAGALVTRRRIENILLGRIGRLLYDLKGEIERGERRLLARLSLLGRRRPR